MRFGSLFSGIGGIDLGLERAGHEIVWQVENDPFCRKVLTKHWPDVPKYEDVHDVGAHNLGATDLIAGGFPCQDISTAGKGAGIVKGNRSGLWFEFARIIRELRPRYVLVENVPAITSRGLGIVLGDLADMRYNAEWGCVSAASVGAPHLRKRVFIIATNAHNEGRRRSDHGRRSLPDGLRHSQGQDQERHKPTEPFRHGEVADADSSGLGEQWGAKPTDEEHAPTELGSWWRTEPNVGRVADGVPARVDRLRGLGNAVVPQVAELLGGWLPSEEV